MCSCQSKVGATASSPASALFAARALTRKGRIVMTLHEWTSLNSLRYLSMIPDLMATDGFVFVSPRQRDAFPRRLGSGH